MGPISEAGQGQIHGNGIMVITLIQQLAPDKRDYIRGIDRA